MRIRVALEPRSYSGAIGEAMQRLRSHLQVTVVESDELGSEVERLAPELVLCSSRKPAPEDNGEPILIEYHPCTEPKPTLRIGERHPSPDVVELDDLLSVVDRAASLARMIPSPEARKKTKNIKKQKISAGGDQTATSGA